MQLHIEPAAVMPGIATPGTALAATPPEEECVEKRAEKPNITEMLDMLQARGKTATPGTATPRITTPAMSGKGTPGKAATPVTAMAAAGKQNKKKKKKKTATPKKGAATPGTASAVKAKAKPSAGERFQKAAFTVERSRSQVLCRTGLRGPGQSWIIKYGQGHSCRTEAAAVTKASGNGKTTLKLCLDNGNGKQH